MFEWKKKKLGCKLANLWYQTLGHKYFHMHEFPSSSYLSSSTSFHPCPLLVHSDWEVLRIELSFFNIEWWRLSLVPPPSISLFRASFNAYDTWSAVTLAWITALLICPILRGVSLPMMQLGWLALWIWIHICPFVVMNYKLVWKKYYLITYAFHNLSQGTHLHFGDFSQKYCTT